jgi:serine/threonine protein kinase
MDGIAGEIGHQYVEGKNLRSLLNGGELFDAPMIGIITCCLVRGLNYLDWCDIIHRNVRPETILID